MTDTAKTEDVGIEPEFAPVRTYTMLGAADDLMINGNLYSAEFVMRALASHDDLVKALEASNDILELLVGDTPNVSALHIYAQAIEASARNRKLLALAKGQA
jgi:hypothetical protein